MPLVPLAPRERDPRGGQRAEDVDDVHLPRERPGEQPVLRERRSALERDGGRALLVEEPLADEIRHPVEEPDTHWNPRFDIPIS